MKAQSFTLKEKLEHTYDVPFNIESGIVQYDPWYTIAPHDVEKSLFVVRLTFLNALRLIMNFEPQKYAANLVYSMGMADPEKKLAFCSFAKVICQKGGKIAFTINEQISDPTDFTDWISNWNKVCIRVTVRPISNHEDPKDIQYTDIADEWGRLFLGMILSLLDIVPLDGGQDTLIGYEEGNQIEILANEYERNPINRVLCLEKYGYKCKVCDFDFSLKYGRIGVDFIHVHHLVPLSKMKGSYIINPLEDLVPVCPNCHAMLHKSDPPFAIEELKLHLKNDNN